MTDIKEALCAFSIVPNKALGQNFLADQGAIAAILDAARIDGENVLEIGPGLGALTRELCRRASRVVAVEIDERMAQALQKIEGLTVLYEDFLKTDMEALFNLLGRRALCVVGNLPYYITTPICMKLLTSNKPIQSMTLMLQKEAAERFFAPVGTKLYGPLTVLSRLAFDIQVIWRLSPADFYPQPDVDSCVIRFERKMGAKPFGKLPALLNMAFMMRRKTLANNLFAGGKSKEEALALLNRAGIGPSVRAEAVTPEQFALLAQNME